MHWITLWYMCETIHKTLQQYRQARRHARMRVHMHTHTHTFTLNLTAPCSPLFFPVSPLAWPQPWIITMKTPATSVLKDGPCCFTSTEARLLIRDGDGGGGGGGRGQESEGLTADTTWKRLERPWTAARTMEVLRRCPPHRCTATSALRNCCFNCRAWQSHKDNVCCTAVEEQPEAKEVQLSQPSSTSLFMISSGLTWGSSSTSLLLISPGTLLKDVPLVEFMYCVFAHIPGESHRKWFRSLLLWSCDFLQVLNNSLCLLIHEAFCLWQEYQSFTDLNFSKDKTITCIQWHPTIKGRSRNCEHASKFLALHMHQSFLHCAMLCLALSLCSCLHAHSIVQHCTASCPCGKFCLLLVYECGVGMH